MLKVIPQIADEIKYLYSNDIGVQSIGKRLGLGSSTIWRVLRRCGVKTRARGVKGTKCVDCGKPTHGAKRCQLHVRVRHAEMDLESLRRKIERTATPEK